MGPISLTLTENLGMKSVSKPKNSLKSIILWSLRIVGWINNGFYFLTVFFFEGCDIVMTPLCRGCFMAKCQTLIEYIRQTKVIRLNNTIEFLFLERANLFAIMRFSRF